ncbi:MAG: 50S ribosomal protein L3 [Deltaproteobacteria bacterium]|nr:50S ribosomal protein L3 [Deltaproteobacteria bacterium]MCB9786055.1 50S ribosomal protein L3 [Deltaproteobacteria bacterium]
MAQGLVGKKVGMTQVFDQYGNLVAVTILEVGPNRVVQVKRRDGKEGYSAVKVGYGEIAEKKLNRPELGVFHHAKVAPARVLREFRMKDAELEGIEVGGELTVEMFRPGQKLDVCATTKGRGFQGVMKRHGFKGAKEKGHGTHEYKRHSGSIGQSAWPSRVIPGKRMAGQMGNDRVTQRGLQVVAVYPEQNLLLVKGAVPGAKNGIVTVNRSLGRK